MIKFTEDERLRPTPEDILQELREAFWRDIDEQMNKTFANPNWLEDRIVKKDKGEKP